MAIIKITITLIVIGFKKLLFSTRQVVIGQFVIGQLNKPSAFKVVVLNQPITFKVVATRVRALAVVLLAPNCW